MAATSARIGFVGLGHMGGNMAERFLAAGYTVYGEERSREHAQDLIEQGLQWCDTPREVAEAADVLFTSVPDDRVLEEVASEPDGILAGLAAGKTWIDVSTVSPQASRELAARVRAKDAWMLDAPVSGSVPQVQSGTLTIMVGGDEDAYRRVEPILRELGTPTHIGDNGQGLVRSTSASPSRCSPSPRGCCWPRGRALTGNARWTSWRRARSARRCSGRERRSSSIRPNRRGST